MFGLVDLIIVGIGFVGFGVIGYILIKHPPNHDNTHLH